ncbi:hypothetical protein HPP92_020829 [Vanilla planifolia]|uniref:Uncharacterized protein n=1 Tax=Vanilla planifolia TaxID=51239 RepID=A0A835UI77_VANPL|nr:hypothetical protein HPP92_020829 [Vanilla planifolia]
MLHAKEHQTKPPREIMSFFNRHKNGHHHDHQHDHHDQRHDQNRQDTHQSYPPSSYPPAPLSYPPAPTPYQSAPSSYPPVPAPYGQPFAPHPPAPAPYGQSHAPYAPTPVSAAQPPYGGPPSQQHTVRVFTKAEENYSLTVRDGIHWYKDFRWSTKVKDEEGLPAFALINKPTGLAIKHSLGPTHPVRLIPYNPEYMDESVLWTESHDTGEGFRCIRMVNNIRLNFDAFHGDKDHGGVHDGTTIVLWEWAKGKNQRWKIVPY